MTELKYIPELYHTAFDPKTYLDMYYAKPEGNEHEKNLQTFFFRVQHKFWSQFQPAASKDVGDGVRCLEYGGGPCIADLISAANKVDHIVFAEYTEANRKAVSSWIAGDSHAHDWKPLIEYVVRELEGDSITGAVVHREEKLKRKIKSIVPCDIAKSPIVDLEASDAGKPFDFVSTSLCLEACVTSEQQYRSVVAKLCEFLKPKGYLCMSGVLEQTFYFVGEEKLYTFPLTKALVEDAMKEAQIDDIKTEVMELEFTGTVSDCSSIFFAFGRKSDRQ